MEFNKYIVDTVDSSARFHSEEHEKFQNINAIKLLQVTPV